MYEREDILERARGGQAEPISIMILVAATLVVALGLYAYFTGVFAQQGRTISLVDAVATVSGGVSFFEEASLINKVGNSNNITYCYMVSISNKMSTPLAVYVTIMPGAPNPNGFVDVGEQFLNIPIYYIGDVPVERRIHVWMANDYDRDGVVELLGQDPVTHHVIEAFNTTPSCTQLYSSRDDLESLLPLLLPPDADDPNFGYNGTKVYMSLEGPTLTEYVRVVIPGTPRSVYVPLWNITIPANGKISVFLFAWNDSPLRAITLVGYVRYEDSFYPAVTLQLTTVKTP